MTRYARAKRDQHAQEGNSTPWSELVKKKSTILTNTAAADSSSSITTTEPTRSFMSHSETMKLKLKKKKVKPDWLLVKTAQVDDQKMANRKLKIMERPTFNPIAPEDIVSRAAKKKLERAIEKRWQIKQQQIADKKKAIAFDGGNAAGKKKEKKQKINEGVTAEMEEEKVSEEVVQKKKKTKKAQSGLEAETSSTTTAGAKVKKQKKKKVAERPVRPPEYISNMVQKIIGDKECTTLQEVKARVRKLEKAGLLVGMEADRVVRKWKKVHERQQAESLQSGEITATNSNGVNEKHNKPKVKQEPKEGRIKQKRVKPEPEEGTIKQKRKKRKMLAVPEESAVKQEELSVKEEKLSVKEEELSPPMKQRTPQNYYSENELTEMADKMATQTLDDVKQMVNSYVDAGKLSRQDAGTVVAKWRDRERRRVMRGVRKLDNSVCFHCRQTGHRLADCPNVDSTQSGSGICFKCGSTEHISSRCLRKNVKGFPYATCFVCKRQGHLSRDCEQNPNGIYPDGGSCNLCGSQKHLKRDCPDLHGTSAVTQTLAFAPTSTAQTMGSADDDNAVFLELDQLPVQKKGVKVVKF